MRHGKLEHLRDTASSALPAPGPTGGRKTYSLAEAAHFLRIHPEELRSRAKAGRAPGAKIGRAWVFLEDDLVAYLRSHYPSPRQALQVTLGKEVECHLSNATQSGGSKSELPTGSEYADLLGLETHVRMLKAPTRRVRFLTHAEAKRLLAELPKHLADLAAFALATGLRRSNFTGLQWSQVDLVRRLAWIHPDQAKARKAIAVPLNAEAILVIRAQIGRHPTHVFSFKGKPIRQVSTKAWYAALERAGIHDFRWHDLRHTWASWHVQQGTPLHVLQELGGWESPEMVRRYAHLTAEHLAPYADRLSALRVVESAADGTFLPQRHK